MEYAGEDQRKFAYITHLEKRFEIARRTVGLYFRKPQGFAFRAGQYLDLRLADALTPNGLSPCAHSFSIASAPVESNLLVAIRCPTSESALENLHQGSKVTIEGPFGSLTLHNDYSRPAVFFAGGVGIAPFRSIIIQAIRTKQRHRIWLFYSSQQQSDAAFLRELQEIDDARYHVVATMTRMSQRECGGETGHISESMLRVHLRGEDLNRAVYYFSGPRGMLVAIHQILARVGVNQDRLRVDEKQAREVFCSHKLIEAGIGSNEPEKNPNRERPF